MATTKKALVMADELVSELRQRQSTLAVALTYDTDGSPLVRLGAGGIGDPGGLFKIMPIDWALAKDVLGLSAEIFGPHIVRLAVEANYASTSDNVADINTWAIQLLMVAAAVSKGARVEVYQETNGTAPVAGTFTAAKLVATYQPNAQYPMTSSQ